MVPTRQLVDWLIGERMTTMIGAFEAKTKLSELLRRVEQGERFTVTVRGKVVAELGPPEPARDAVREAAFRRLRSFPRVQGVSGEEVLEWIREGRK
jgi:antitoxin (DNA-binding transcriptional repressor) of toxin-antitoxin stability system